MPKTLFATISQQFTIQERADTALSPSSTESGLSRIYDQYNVDVALSGAATSFPQVGNDVADLSHTLSGGTTKDFDLTAVPWAGDTSETFDATGKKVVGWILRFAIDNAATGVAFGEQGGNGYELFGTAVPVFYPGTNISFVIADPLQATSFTVNTPAVAAGAKDLRFTGTDGDEWDCLLIFSE
jgi:hypothetical protein